LAVADGKPIVLIFEWATSVRVDLNCKVFSLLTWEATFEPIEHDRWKVIFDFAHSGSISFDCDKVFLADE
jgi:hypothetical protein